MGFRNNVMSILENSSFFIHTPISPDPLPTVIFEAINTKTPVITNNKGGAYEILNYGKNGLIINNKLIDESVKKVLDYIKNKKKQQENIENAFLYVSKNFSYNQFKANILKIIE